MHSLGWGELNFRIPLMCMNISCVCQDLIHLEVMLRNCQPAPCSLHSGC